jgi:hypothetical protein
MRVRLNPRSVEQLQQVMESMGETNPTHVLQQMITMFNKSLSDQSLNEDIHDNQENKNLRAMPS